MSVLNSSGWAPPCLNIYSLVASWISIGYVFLKGIDRRLAMINRTRYLWRLYCIKTKVNASFVTATAINVNDLIARSRGDMCDNRNRHKSRASHSWSQATCNAFCSYSRCQPKKPISALRPVVIFSKHFCMFLINIMAVNGSGQDLNKRISAEDSCEELHLGLQRCKQDLFWNTKSNIVWRNNTFWDDLIPAATTALLIVILVNISLN